MIAPMGRYVFRWNGKSDGVGDASVEPMPCSVYERHNGQPVLVIWVSPNGLAHVIAEDQTEFLAYHSELLPMENGYEEDQS